MEKKKETKTYRKIIRLSEKERDMVNQKMKESNLDFSKLVLSSIFNKEIIIHQEKESKKELLRELSLIGNNINQIAKKINSSNKGLDKIGFLLLNEIKANFEALKGKYVS